MTRRSTTSSRMGMVPPCAGDDRRRGVAVPARSVVFARGVDVRVKNQSWGPLWCGLARARALCLWALTL
eukprot:scaffold6310_cov67-Phaeocystis_antarctica.AAC.9